MKLYKFTNLQTGKPCCSTDNINNLCSKCREQASRTQAATLTAAAAGVPSNEAPPVPSLVDAIAARRAATTHRGIPLGTVPEPVFFGGRRPQPPTVAAANEEPPDPPSLSAEILRRRSR